VARALPGSRMFCFRHQKNGHRGEQREKAQLADERPRRLLQQASLCSLQKGPPCEADDVQAVGETEETPRETRAVGTA